MERFSATADQKMHHLLNEVRLGDSTPSQLLRKMRTLASNKVPESVIKARWLALLPINTKRILKIFQASSLDEYAASADELLEVPPGPEIFATSAFNALHPSQPNVAAVQHSTDLASIKEALGTLIGFNKQLLDKVDAMVYNNHNRNFSSDRQRTRSTSRSQSPVPRGGLCFFHKKFGETAYKCKLPCNYKPPK